MPSLPCSFLSFVVRTPPTPTLFPYRRSSDLQPSASNAIEPKIVPPAISATIMAARSSARWRSEEHTSELQSLRHLVCRLLLEKKKIIDGAGAVGRGPTVGAGQRRARPAGWSD